MYKLLDTNLNERDRISLSLADRDRSLFNKVANEREFPKEVDEAIKGLKKKDGHSYLLLTAMGAGDIWGANNNADHFPVAALLGKQNSSTKWGSVSYEPSKDERLDQSSEPKVRYKTFEDAHFFHHHKNKIERDPSFGKVRNSFWFPKMGTILLILEVNNKKDPETAEAIARNTPLSFSMGCTVPYDVCSICGNKAPSILRYCNHLQYQKNKILADGRRVAAINLHPRFFDISKVTRPAFLAGMQLEKIAGNVDLADYFDIGRFDKLAEEEPETIAIPQHMLDAIERVSNAEDTIEFGELKTMVRAANHNLQDILGAYASKGIVLKPNEYAALVFLCLKQEEIAKKVIGSKVVLDSNPKIPDTFELSTPSSASKKVEMLAERIRQDSINMRSIHTLEDRIYDSARKLIKTSAEFNRELGVGAVLTGLYLLYRNQVKEHPVMSAAIGLGLRQVLLGTSEAPDLNKIADFKDIYLSNSNLTCAPNILLR